MCGNILCVCVHVRKKKYAWVRMGWYTRAFHLHFQICNANMTVVSVALIPQMETVGEF